MNHNRTLGLRGEELAAKVLRGRGMSIVETNWRCARGEIDIVARDGDSLVFCEVKTRTSEAFGAPAEAVGGVKASRLRGLGVQWLLDHPGPWGMIRFDVVSIVLPGGGPARVRHLRGVL